MSRVVSIRSYAKWVNLFFDEADVAAAFHASESNIRKVVRVYAKPHVFVQIMCGDVIAPHHGYIALSIAHNDIRSAFDQNPEGVGIECEKGEKAMKQHQNHAATERRKKCCRTVNGARKYCRKNDE